VIAARDFACAGIGVLLLSLIAHAFTHWRRL